MHLKRAVSISIENCLFILYKISAFCVAISTNSENVFEMVNWSTIVLPCHKKQLNGKTITQMYLSLLVIQHYSLKGCGENGGITLHTPNLNTRLCLPSHSSFVSLGNMVPKIHWIEVDKKHKEVLENGSERTKGTASCTPLCLVINIITLCT